MSVAAIVVSCLLVGAHLHNVPVDVMLGIYEVEGGQIGRESATNRNGTRDLGLWQINTHWLEDFSKAWRMSPDEVRRILRDDACVNVFTAAYILRRKIDAAGGDLCKGIAWYNSATPGIGERYRDKVLAAMKRQGVGSNEALKGCPYGAK